MHSRMFVILGSLVGLFFIFSASTEQVIPMTKDSLEDASEFAVIEDWIACYQDKHGTPGEAIVAVFYNGDRIYPQHSQQRLPYREYENRLYLWVKYNHKADQGCFVEATGAHLSAVKSLAAESSTAIDLPTTENTTLIDNGASENTVSNNNQSDESVPPLNSSAAENIPALDNKSEKLTTIHCVTPGSAATRRLETSFPDYPAKLPCKVIYYREDGKTQVIADAKHSEGYCAQKREAFLEKLQAWGWQCQ